LSSLPADEGGNWLEDILRIDSEALEVARVSYWSLHADPPRIFCELCYIAPSRLFERGAVLQGRTSPVYFGQLDKLQVIDAADARADPRTRDLGPYLESKNIGALLDAPVFVQNRPAGILCHEHVGGSRAWSPADQEFALAISQTVVARLEAHARNQSEEAERRAHLGKFWYRPPGGESWADVAQRVRDVLRDLRLDHAGRHLLVVSHDVPILMHRYVLEALTPEEAVGLSGQVRNCALTVYRGRAHGMDLEVFNDVTPVEEDPEATVTAHE